MATIRVGLQNGCRHHGECWRKYLELDEEKIEAFPVALLQRLIRVNDEVIKDFVDRYFNQL
jgi:hypothetical protein